MIHQGARESVFQKEKTKTEKNTRGTSAAHQQKTEASARKGKRKRMSTKGSWTRNSRLPNRLTNHKRASSRLQGRYQEGRPGGGTRTVEEKVSTVPRSDQCIRKGGKAHFQTRSVFFKKNGTQLQRRKPAYLNKAGQGTSLGRRRKKKYHAPGPKNRGRRPGRRKERRKPLILKRVIPQEEIENVRRNVTSRNRRGR